VLIIFIIAAFITPTPDIPTQCLFAGPMLLLYGISILVSYVFQKRRGSDDDQQGDGGSDFSSTEGGSGGGLSQGVEEKPPVGGEGTHLAG